MRKLRFALLTVATLFAAVTSANAAAVSWSAVDDATTAGDLIGGPTIAFTAAEYPGSTSPTGTFFTGDGGDTGNEDLNTVFNSHGWNGAGGTVTLDGLTDGADYNIQLLSAGDTRACCVGRTQVADDGAGNVSGDMFRGNYSVVGSFTASGTSQDIGIVGGSVEGVDPGLSGYILTSGDGSLVSAVNFTNDGVAPTVVVPEPASMSLAFLAGLGLLGVRRRS